VRSALEELSADGLHGPDPQTGGGDRRDPLHEAVVTELVEQHRGGSLCAQ
jgi:hypothetical protein